MIIDGYTPKELLRSESAEYQCELCGKPGPTIIEHKVGLLAWLGAALVCMSGCSMGCCFIPFCMDSCLDVHHRCSSCRQPLTTYKKI